MIYGIDFGNCSSRVAVLNSGSIVGLVSNSFDLKYDFGAYVYFDEDGTVVTGEEARALSVLWPQRSMRYLKRGLSGFEEMVYEIDGVNYTAGQVATHLFSAIRESIEFFNGDCRPRVALTVPAQWLPCERDRLRTAALEAGLLPVYTIPEPLAAVYADAYHEGTGEKTVLLVDLGGISLNLAAVKMFVGQSGGGVPTHNARIVTVDSDDTLGGYAWDERLYDHILNQIVDEYGLFPDDEARQEIRLATERMKLRLCVSNFAVKHVLVDEMRVRVKVSKDEFICMTAHLVERVCARVDLLLEKIEGMQIDQVWMLGGGSRIIGVQDALECRFPGKVRMKEEHLLAEGAAVAAAAAGFEQELN